MRRPAPLMGMDQPNNAAEDHFERLLDRALEETFPASDPVAVFSEAQALTEAAATETG